MLMHQRSILAFWKNICNIWDPVNTKIHIFPTFATINYFPRGAIVKVYREYAFCSRHSPKRPQYKSQCKTDVSKVAKRIQQWHGPSIRRRKWIIHPFWFTILCLTSQQFVTRVIAGMAKNALSSELKMWWMFEWNDRIPQENIFLSLKLSPFFLF